MCLWGGLWGRPKSQDQYESAPHLEWGSISRGLSRLSYRE